MKTKVTILFVLSCLTSTFSQVKESEISTRDKQGQPRFIKFNETKVFDDPQAIKIFLKSMFRSENNTEFKVIKERQTDKLYKINLLKT